MSPIKDLKLICEALNKEGAFSEGDVVEGAVTFTLTKQTKVKSLLVKVKGDARVRWTEGSGDDESTYSDHRRYFKVKQYVVAENAKGRPKKCVGALICLLLLTLGKNCVILKLVFKDLNIVCLSGFDMPMQLKRLHYGPFFFYISLTSTHVVDLRM